VGVECVRLLALLSVSFLFARVAHDTVVERAAWNVELSPRPSAYCASSSASKYCSNEMLNSRALRGVFVRWPLCGGCGSAVAAALILIVMLSAMSIDSHLLSNFCSSLCFNRQYLVWLCSRRRRFCLGAQSARTLHRCLSNVLYLIVVSDYRNHLVEYHYFFQTFFIV